jgi:hypothetical protein
MKSVVIALLVLAPFVPVAAADDGDASSGPIDVFVPAFMGCTWTGSYKPYVETLLVRVWVYTCDPET